MIIESYIILSGKDIYFNTNPTEIYVLGSLDDRNYFTLDY